LLDFEEFEKFYDNAFCVFFKKVLQNNENPN
jgi:hypothetical protein